MANQDLSISAATSGGATRCDTLRGFETMPRSVSRREWDAAMAILVEAQRKSDALDDRVNAVNAAYAEQAKAVAHTSIQVGNVGRTISTSSERDVADARRSQASLCYLEDLPGNYDQYRAYDALIKADDERKAKLEQIDKRLGWTKINDRYDELTDQIVEAEGALLALPAPDGEALMWKVQRLYKPGEGIWEADIEQQTHADLRRFLLNGRA